MWTSLRARPVDTAVLIVAMGILVGHQWMHRDFVIDDAAICFAYARNIAEGHGIVPWPGAERIEGFSNPTWIAVLAFFQLFGLDGFTVAKPLAALFGIATVPLVYRIARAAMPDDAGPAALFAPLTLAFSAQLAIWSASGLENALWSLLLALAIERTIAGGRSGRFLGSAVAWLLVTWTRPEGVLYAAVGGAYFAWMAVAREPQAGWRLAGAWAAVVGVPSLALEAFRLWYFAWPLPNTYYAKLVVREISRFSWDGRGWLQLRDFSGRLWHGYLFPVYVLGLLGRTSRAQTVILATAALFLLPPPEAIAELPVWPDLPEFPSAWLSLRMVLLAVGLVGLPLLGDRTTPGFDARALSWSCASVAVLYSVYVGGDWMGGYRWMSFMVVPMSVLFAVGAREIVTLAERHLAMDVPRPGEWGWSTVGWLAAALLVGAWIPPNLNQSKDHLNYNNDETAHRIMRRAEYTDSVRKRTFYEGRVVNLEMDQGGNLWSRPDYRPIDMASLVDISMGRHTYEQRAFIEEYVFQEHPPTFGHAHGWWARYSDFESYPQWKDYFLLPPNDETREPHGGMWANRRLVLAREWPGVKRPITFGSVVVQGLTVPASPWPSGGDGYLEVGLSSPPRAPGTDLNLVAFLLSEADTVVASWDLPLGYGLLGMDQWRPDEVFVGRFAVPVPRNVAPGRYRLGLVVMGPKGAVWQPTSSERAPAVEVGTAERARFAIGELVYPEIVEVRGLQDVEQGAAAARARSVELAGAGKCGLAESEWVRSKRFAPRAWEVHAEQLPLAARAIADCWARRAESEPEKDAVWLAKAHEWDPRSAELARVGEPVGERLWEEGLAARSFGDPEAEYRAFSALLGFQPWRSWARRYAEEARDRRLGLDTRGQPRSIDDRPAGGED